MKAGPAEFALGVCCAGLLGAASSEGDLIAAAKRGDPSAFEEIVRRHQRRVYNLAYRMLRDRDDAEDVTQESFLRAFEALPSLRSERALHAWICRIAANLCVSWLRAKERRKTVPLGPESAAGANVPPDPTATRAAEVRRAVEELPPKYRVAIVAFYVEGRSYREAAEALGIGVRTLKTRLYRARNLLRDAMAAGLAEEDALT